MAYVVVFELVPPAPFGVPEHGRTVLPGDAGTYTGDAYHAAFGIRAGYGTLSQFRTGDEAIGADIELAGHAARIDDNFLRVEVDAETHGDALTVGRDLVEGFTQQLGLAGGRWMSAVPLFIENTSGDDRLAPRRLKLASVTVYDLPRLELDVALAARATGLSDDRLQRGRVYYQHALWLFEQRAAVPDPFDANSRMLVASVFLNLWKAASSVIGDPTSDRDYQARYRQLGLDQSFFDKRIEPLRRLRNDYDVAHYHLDPAALEAVEQRFGEASETVRMILTRHTEMLLDEYPRTGVVRQS